MSEKLHIVPRQKNVRDETSGKVVPFTPPAKPILVVEDTDGMTHIVPIDRPRGKKAPITPIRRP